jgi:hypothetical protein
MLLPDLRQVQVFDTQNNTNTLRSVDAISASLREMLKNVILEYNQTLISENNAANTRYTQYASVYNFLAQEDIYANVNRQYALMDENLLIDTLGSENIDTIAQALWLHNLPWLAHESDNEVLSYIDTLQRQASLDPYIGHVTNMYLDESVLSGTLMP